MKIYMEIKIHPNNGKSYNLKSDKGLKQLPKYIKVHFPKINTQSKIEHNENINLTKCSLQ